MENMCNPFNSLKFQQSSCLARLKPAAYTINGALLVVRLPSVSSLAQEVCINCKEGKKSKRNPGGCYEETKQNNPLYTRSHKSFKDTTLNTPGEVETTAQPADMKS